MQLSIWSTNSIKMQFQIGVFFARNCQKKWIFLEREKNTLEREMNIELLETTWNYFLSSAVSNPRSIVYIFIWVPLEHTNENFIVGSKDYTVQRICFISKLYFDGSWCNSIKNSWWNAFFTPILFIRNLIKTQLQFDIQNSNKNFQTISNSHRIKAAHIHYRKNWRNSVNASRK